MVDRRRFIRNTAVTASAMLSSTFSTAFHVSAIESSRFNKPAQGPFLHGIASGDPLHDRVIIWTRITRENDGPVKVEWQISRADSFHNILQSGELTTDRDRDYTIKVDVQQLSPATTYYYRFVSDNKKSPVGKTKTTAATSD
ncbi:MAG: PhoD-like phosphatase N-terminal domain-containing protein, partial [Chitinophagaceae bacterium]